MKKVELICFLYDKNMEEIGVKVPDIEAVFKISLDDIESVRQRISEDPNEACKETCLIRTKSGDSFVIKKSYKEMDAMWV